MSNREKFYINGEWVEPSTSDRLDVINPATEESIGQVPLGGQEDVDKAVAAAVAAFESFGSTTKEERIELLSKIIDVYKTRIPEIAGVISEEMGAPLGLANAAQAPAGLGHFMTTLRVLQGFEFEENLGHARVIKEPAGVCGFHHAVELANQPNRVQSSTSACCGLHDGSEAFRSGTVQCCVVCRSAARSRGSCRCIQSGAWRRTYRWCSVVVPP